MSAFEPFQHPPGNLNDIAAQPVIPLPPRRTMLPLGMLLPAVAGIVLAILRVRHPLVVISQRGDEVSYEVSGPHITMSADILALAAVLAVGSLLLRPIRHVALLAVVIVILCVGLGLTLLNHRSAKVILTPESVTAPLRVRGIFPGDSITLRYDKMQMLEFVGDPDRWEKSYQRIHTGFGAANEAEINIGPLFGAVHDQILSAASRHGVRTVHY